ncbi:hypothetical protein C0J52_06348 [Blattella germanica]|nr:hypothetical protein C0J52_06348 [Blattella germanica]
MEREHQQSRRWFTSALFLIVIVLCVNISAAKDKYRVCIPVSEKSANKKYSKYCPILEKAGSKVTCVLGQSRLDCLRKIFKGKADFGIFEAEDVLIAANYKTTDEMVPVLVTNELSYLKIVRKSANITRIEEMQGKKFCHTGYGQETDWTEVMSKFFEARVVPQQCNSDLSVFENRIKSSSEFFEAACKAGPWVPDRQLDAKLKQTYSNLCKLCDNPAECSTMDKYWGRVGPLYCLTDGAGDIAWARLAEIQIHFGLNTMESNSATAPADDYRLLCEDNRLAPLDQPENCAWLARPWKAVITKRDVAVHVQKLLSLLKDTKRMTWEWALVEILEVRTQNIVPLESMVPPEDYLQKEMVKCDWLKRTADVYGIEPEITCLKANSTEDCMKAVQGNIADVVTIQPDDMSMAYRIAAIVKKNSDIKYLSDLKGKKACFPVYEGAGWNSILSVLRSDSLISTACASTESLGDFFSDSCVPQVNRSHNFPSHLQALCDGDIYNGELGAFRCLATGEADVAFISLDTLKENTGKWKWHGTVEKDIYIALMELGNLFGNHHKTQTAEFQMFAPFDGQKNVLFQDVTYQFEDQSALQQGTSMVHNYEKMFESISECSAAQSLLVSSIATLISLLLVFVISCK